jgi:hypothetical protein
MEDLIKVFNHVWIPISKTGLPTPSNNSESFHPVRWKTFRHFSWSKSCFFPNGNNKYFAFPCVREVAIIGYLRGFKRWIDSSLEENRLLNLEIKTDSGRIDGMLRLRRKSVHVEKSTHEKAVDYQTGTSIFKENAHPTSARLINSYISKIL